MSNTFISYHRYIH